MNCKFCAGTGKRDPVTEKAALTRIARKNGKLGAAHGIKGGRPGNPEIKRIMEERGVSRQRAHQILKARTK